MKKNKTKIILAALFAVTVLVTVISGCNKPDDNNNGGVTAKVKTHSNTSNSPITGPDTTTSTYIYDSQGRVSSISTVYLPAGVTTLTTFTYNNNQIIETRESSIYIYTLNSSGYVTLRFDSAYGASYSSTVAYTYDASGHRLSAALANSTSGVYFTRYYGWDGDNMTTSTENGSYTYTYLTDKANTIGNANVGMSFYGKDSKNLINTSVNSGSTTTYFYDYDSQNRVIRVNGKDTYTYY